MLIHDAFFGNHLKIEDHGLIVKKKGIFSVISKTQLKNEKGMERVKLNNLLHTLIEKVKTPISNQIELNEILILSDFFKKKLNPTHSILRKKIIQVFNRFQNLFCGYGFKSNLEILKQLEILAQAKLAKIPSKISFQPQEFWDSMKSHRSNTNPLFFNDPDFKLVEKNFSLFCQKVEANKKIETIKQVHGQTSIPPIVHFIWLGSPINAEVNSILNTWKENCSDFQIKVWTDKDIENFSWINRKAFDEAQTFAEKADIWRYQILYREGGIYSDTDVICFKSFKDLINHNITFFGCQETNQVVPGLGYGKCLIVCNAIIGAAKNSPVMKYCIDNLKTASESSEHLVVRTGPILLSKAIHEALNSADSQNNLILPCSYFYPLPFSLDLRKKKLSLDHIKENYVDYETMVVHLWNASWVEKEQELRLKKKTE